MGSNCCREVEKGKRDQVPGPPADLEDVEGSEGELADDDGSEVVASSDGELDPNEYKQDVEQTLKTTGANLKRGKTMAMKEAINTAKKLGLEEGVIDAAEKQLDEHKRKQKRDATEEEVRQFFESKLVNEIPQVERMIKKAKEAECLSEVLDKLQNHLELLIITRALETEESETAREYMKSSCSDFVINATKGGGRSVVFLNVENGKKTSAVMSLDPPLQNLIITVEENEDAALITPVKSLHARPAVKDSNVRNAKGFQTLDKGDADCSVAVKHELDNKAGVWCLVEPTKIRRDRLVEALVILAESCRAR